MSPNVYTHTHTPPLALMESIHKKRDLRQSLRSIWHERRKLDLKFPDVLNQTMYELCALCPRIELTQL